MYRVANDVDQSRYILRITQSHRHVENLLRQFDCAFHFRAAAGQHDPGGADFFKTAAAQFRLHQAQQFFVTRLHNFSQRLPRQAARFAIADAWHFDGFVIRGQLAQRAGIADLQVVGILRRRAQCHGDIVGDLVAGDRVSPRCAGLRHRKKPRYR